ncbi:MAG: hypothetical protein Q8N70_03595 [Deltaproteobacteria bacterium]|nr:hypothetical protein [Deltaproteobacteria bacterium]
MRFGFHISISGGFSKVVEKAEIRGCENIQFFSRNPNGLIVKWLQSVTQTNHLPFDFPFALPVPGRVGQGRLSKGERFAQPPAQRASGSERTGLSKHEIDFGNSLVMGDDTRIEARGLT